MADNPQGNANPVDPQGQQLNNQQQQQPAQQQAQPQAQPQQPQVDDASQRTREQFEKLLEANRRLNEQNQKYQQMIDQSTPATQTQPQQQPSRSQTQVNPNDYVDVDPATGERFINEEKLQQKLDALTKAASEAQSKVQQYIERSEKESQVRQTQEAYREYPELNPQGEKWDVDFSRRVRAILQDSMFNTDDYGGRSLSYREAADYVKKGVLPTSQPGSGSQQQAQPDGQAQQQGQQPAQAQEPTAQELKEQANAEPANQPQSVRDTLSQEADLRQMQISTRYGSDEALARRLMHTPHINSEPGKSPGGSERA